MLRTGHQDSQDRIEKDRTSSGQNNTGQYIEPNFKNQKIIISDKPEYPVNLLGSLYVVINFTYTGPVINNLVMNEGIAEWGGINCQWSDLPTFGLL